LRGALAPRPPLPTPNPHQVTLFARRVLGWGTVPGALLVSHGKRTGAGAPSRSRVKHILKSVHPCKRCSGVAKLGLGWWRLIARGFGPEQGSKRAPRLQRGTRSGPRRQGHKSSVQKQAPDPCSLPGALLISAMSAMGRIFHPGFPSTCGRNRPQTSSLRSPGPVPHIHVHERSVPQTCSQASSCRTGFAPPGEGLARPGTLPVPRSKPSMTPAQSDPQQRKSKNVRAGSPGF